MLKFSITVLSLALLFQSQAFAKKTSSSKILEEKRLSILTEYDKYKHVYATIKTNMGDIVVELLPKEAPLAVENFVGLAEGTKEFVDMGDPKFRKIKKKFYDGLTFHRIAPNFVIQGGCPKGNGTSGPGYSFPLELNNSLDFSKPGMLAMANMGKKNGGNGSQFFITLRRLDKLLKKEYSIFGRVKDGMSVVKNMEKIPTYPNEKPRKKIIIKTIEIERVANKP